MGDTGTRAAHTKEPENGVKRRRKHTAGRGTSIALHVSQEFIMVLTLATPKPRADLTARARAEFLEMPGLSLTLAQAARLCGAPPEDCQLVLDELIADGLLRRTGDRYVRADTGRPWSVKRASNREWRSK
jgi:hypothetical protein